MKTVAFDYIGKATKEELSGIILQTLFFIDCCIKEVEKITKKEFNMQIAFDIIENIYLLMYGMKNLCGDKLLDDYIVLAGHTLLNLLE